MTACDHRYVVSGGTDGDATFYCTRCGSGTPPIEAKVVPLHKPNEVVPIDAPIDMAPSWEDWIPFASGVGLFLLGVGVGSAIVYSFIQWGRA